METVLKDFEIVRHGICWPHYFQGCGIAHTPFEHCATGIGDTEYEALEDALESAAQAGHTMPTTQEEKELDSMDLTDHASGNVEDGQEDTPFWYVSIRYNVSQPTI